MFSNKNKVVPNKSEGKCKEEKKKHGKIGQDQLWKSFEDNGDLKHFYIVPTLTYTKQL